MRNNGRKTEDGGQRTDDGGNRVPFTALYDWLARRTDLTTTEKIIVAQILRYGKSGCFKSNNTFAQDLGIDRVSFIRALKSLVDKAWVAILFPARRERILYINEEMIADLPLFEEVRGCGKPVRKSLLVSGETPPSDSGAGSGALQQVSGAAPPALYRKRKDLSYRDETREEREILFATSAMKEKARAGLSAEELERRRQRQQQALGIQK